MCIRDSIKENYTEDLSLETLAEIFGYSPAYLSRMFQKYAGINYKSYLQGIRLEYAYRELLETNHTISDTALNNGLSLIHICMLFIVILPFFAFLTFFVLSLRLSSPYPFSLGSDLDILAFQSAKRTVNPGFLMGDQPFILCGNQTFFTVLPCRECQIGVRSRRKYDYAAKSALALRCTRRIVPVSYTHLDVYKRQFSSSLQSAF